MTSTDKLPAVADTSKLDSANRTTLVGLTALAQQLAVQNAAQVGEEDAFQQNLIELQKEGSGI